MSRALSKPQPSLFFGDTPAPVRLPARQSERGPFVHLCQAPGCGEWGERGFAESAGGQRWFCFEHRALGERP